MSKEQISLSTPNFRGNEKKYVVEAVDAEWVSTAGAFISRFEEAMADRLGVGQACACQSGTAGLHLCLRHFGVTAGDLVLVPTLTFIATINAVLYQSAEPVFFDCDGHMCIDAGQVEEYLARECRTDEDGTVEIASGKRVKAIVPVHVFGDHCDMARLMELAERYRLIVIEDAAEALGGAFTQKEYRGRPVGTVGHAGVLSFNGNKIITTGGGGMVVSRDEAAVRHIRYLSQQAKDDALYFVHEEYGYNYRMTNLQAALGLAQLEELDGFLRTKRRNYARYCEKLAGCAYGGMLPFGGGEGSNHWFYSFALEKPDADKRDRLLRHLNERGIQARPIWKLNHTQTPFRKYRAMNCARAENFYNRVVNIPCGTNLTEEQQDRVCGALLDFERY
ncbi:LegC family aminotransferase [Oscillibacter sp.]|uniref:LegC family aminotransferase n=1 Tax=Oscillibacter sp. TaxID=1945593 RepID=UPI002D80E94D|nr:LegC family aminotransferase [Oscillibacter sp.]